MEYDNQVKYIYHQWHQQHNKHTYLDKTPTLYKTYS